MAAIGRVFARAFSAEKATNTTLVVVVFCLVGLVASLLVANYGVNLDIVWPDGDF